jgi:DNA-binding MarR family transcriptional regulator
MDGARILELVERLANLVRSEDRRGGRAGPIAPVHRAALGYLARANRFSDTPAALADYLGSTRGTVSQTLALLERRGLVRRAADARDGRVVRLRLTARGRRLAAARPDASWRAAIEALPEGPRAAAEEALEAILRGLQRARGGRTFGVCGSCRHLQRLEGGGFRCGLTSEPLAPEETERICHHHDFPPAPGTAG